VAYHDSFFDTDFEFLNIIQDYCDGGNLDDKIKTAAQVKLNLEFSLLIEYEKLIYLMLSLLKPTFMFKKLSMSSNKWLISIPSILFSFTEIKTF